MPNFRSPMEDETVRRLQGIGLDFSPYLGEQDPDNDYDDDEEYE